MASTGRAFAAATSRLAAVVVGALAVPVLACNGESTHQVQGILVSVQAQEITNAQAVELRDASGELHRFQVSPEVATDASHPTSASHLRQHMVNADPVVVWYRDIPNGSLAFRIVDASAPPPAADTPRTG